MSSRMDRYKDEDTRLEKRTSRNQNIYSKLEDKDFENLNLEGNVSVLGKGVNELDIDKLKTLLDEKYQTRSSRKIETEDLDDSIDSINDEVTKEYDLKKMLETAHKNKIPDYDRERFQKLKNTQFEILNSLNIESNKEKDDLDSLTKEETDLIDLIKTVSGKNDKNGFSKDDLLDELKGGDKTEVLDPIDIEEIDEPTGKKPTVVEELEKTKRLSRQELDDEIDKVTAKLDNVIEKIKEDKTQELTKTEELSNSFYTGNLQINDKDLDDFSDLEDDSGAGTIVIKILIIILVFVTLAVLVFILNKYLNLGLF